MNTNKKFLHVIAALWILVFHLWIPVGGSIAEQFLVKIGYVGVDLFFFTSAASLAGRDIDHASLLRNRFSTIYLKFVLFVVVAAIYKHYDLTRVLKCITGIELFHRGGGAFLWFLPAIMLFYLLFPLFLRWSFRYKVPAVLAVWVLFSLIAYYGFGYKAIFIFTNRIPVMLIGYLLRRCGSPGNAGSVTAASTASIQRRLLACIPAGLALLYLWGFTRRLNAPWYEFYLVSGIVLTVGLAALSGYVRSSKFQLVWNILGSATVELYALQMIFGTKLVSVLYKATGSKFGTNMLMMVILWGGAIVLARGYEAIRRLIIQNMLKDGAA